MEVLEQIDCEDGVAVAAGVGLTVTVEVIELPAQALVPGPVGVIVKVTVTGELVVLVNEPLISPVPEDAIPVTVLVLSLVHAKVVPVTLLDVPSAMPVMDEPEQILCDEVEALATGTAFTVIAAELEEDALHPLKVITGL